MQYGEYLYEYECYAQIYDYLKEVNFIWQVAIILV
jgi:hypothetical protein